MRPARATAVPLDSPGVAFGADFLPRLQRLVARRDAARARRGASEGSAAGARAGAGLEFEGYRPYRPGENLRALDWGLYARLDRPFVRLARRETSERWALLLDASASMGLGGKLQAAAEATAAVACVALRLGAAVRILASPGAGAEPRALDLGRRAELPALLAFLSALRAEGRAGLAALCAEPARVRAAGRVIALGDLQDLEPASFLSLARRGRELSAAQILAPREVAPGAALGEGDVAWIDAESGGRRVLALDRATRERYASELDRHLAAWRAAAARHRAYFRTWSSATPFEDVSAGLLGT